MKLFLLLLFPCLFIHGSAQNLEVYVSAHPDDWQLFMNPNAYKSVSNPENKVIFLHTTAGDAGHGMGFNDYALAREEGSSRAIRFMCNSLQSELPLGAEMEAEQVKVKGHFIRKKSYGNTVAYFLRLPDGNYRGPGYESTGLASLRRMLQGSIPSLGAIDQSTTYESMEDLKKTLIKLIKGEAKGYESIIFNIPETDTLVNPDDHSDHLNSSLLFQHIAKPAGVSMIRYYQEYSTNKKPMNVFDAEFLVCAGTWGATASGLSDMGHNSTWDEVHNSWIGRQYFREEKIE